MADFVQENKHLPGVASAKEVAEDGLDLAGMQHAQMEKIEELSLYVIQMDANMTSLKKENEELKKQIEAVEK